METIDHVVLLQTHRFRPIAPLAIPHAATADVQVSNTIMLAFIMMCCHPLILRLQYGQYVIPKGSIVFANVCEYSGFPSPSPERMR